MIFVKNLLYRNFTFTMFIPSVRLHFHGEVTYKLVIFHPNVVYGTMFLMRWIEISPP